MATAILAGDGFFGESLKLVTTRQGGTPKQLLGVVRELARAAGVDGIVGGQSLDLSYSGRVVDTEMLHAAHSRKIGALIEASARIGAILAGATSEEREVISDYARWVGLCRRIEDDILNATTAVEGPSKAPESDAEGGKATFVHVYGLSGARRLAEKSYERALETLEQIGGDTGGLAELARFARYEDR